MPFRSPFLLSSPCYQTLAPSLSPFSRIFSFSPAQFLVSCRIGSLNGLNIEKRARFGWRYREKKLVAGVNGVNSSLVASDDGAVKKRNVVEHILLMRAKTDISDVEEKDMLDSLYTSQYQMRGIIAISLGRIEESNDDNFTHALYMRFQTKQDLAKFYVNSYYSGVLKEHVMPYCYKAISVDFESEVEDDILPIFRRGEDFNFGVECVLLISTLEAALEHAIKDAFTAFRRLISDFQSLIVQATQGSNFNQTDSMYTHAVVIRFTSLDALEMFRGSSEYKEIWRSKFKPITKKSLLIYFSVDPVGTELM